MSILRLGHKTKGSSEEKQGHKMKRAKSLYNTEQHLLNGHNTFLLEKQNVYSKMVQASCYHTPLTCRYCLWQCPGAVHTWMVDFSCQALRLEWTLNAHWLH